MFVFYVKFTYFYGEKNDKRKNTRVQSFYYVAKMQARGTSDVS